ncbi:MAG: helix-turn-helix transcriptional regulator [Actinomycetota bacterium]|nr:helix-turn-helix transcriptional regulator [Actinomycetota bacterium]
MAAARINQLRLRREMASRGWNACDLARLAGLSAATLTAALQGRPVSLRTLQKIAVVIARTPPIPEALDLLESTAVDS